jgi:hypothetical protein
MFTKACDIASKFIEPVIVSIQYQDKTVECLLGAFVILNEEGWIMTVAHLLQPSLTYQKHQQEIKAYSDQISDINNDQLLNANKKRRKIARLNPNPKWIINLSYWWGKNIRQVVDLKLLSENDLAIGRLANYDAKEIAQYPIIKEPNNIQPGTSLCKLGFPFHKPESIFDEQTKSFKLQKGTLPVPMFPIEGIFTRNIDGGKSQDGKYNIMFLETSSPGLRGQSGGPIFDTQGTIWAIQSRTNHLPLGFAPKVIKNGKAVEENQFLNVGWGIHPLTLVSFLKENGVNFKMSNY